MQADKVNAPIRFADSVAFDSFGRLRTSQPQLRFSCIFDTDKRDIFWTERAVTGGAASHVSGKSSVMLSVSAPGDEIIRQTKEYFVYRAGQSQLIFATFYAGGLPTDVIAEIGYFDDSDGVYLEIDGAVPTIVLRSSVAGSPVRVPQASWDDPLDGTGASGKTLNINSTQILVIDLQWLGVGRVRVGFDIDGVVVPVYSFNHANSGMTNVYMKLAKLPLRYGLRAGSGGSAADIKQICATVIREGGSDDPDIQREVSLDADATVTTTWTAVLGVRLKTANIRATIRMLAAEAFNTGTNDLEFAIVLNPTLGTPPSSWLAVEPDSVAEFVRHTSTVTVVNGSPQGHIYPLGGYVAGGSGGRSGDRASQRLGNTIPVVADYTGTPDEVWLVAKALASTTTVRGILAFIEER